MSNAQFLQCLASAAALKEITPTQLKKAEARFENRRLDLIDDGLAPMDAAIRAADEVTEQFRIENSEQKRRRLNQMRANIQAWTDLQAYKGGKTWRGWRGFFDTDDRAEFANYARLKDGYLGLFHSMMDGLIAKYKPKYAGIVRPREGQINLLREIFGESSGDAEAQAMAQAWKETHDAAVKLFRMHGGSIGQIDNWHLPQNQDYLKLYRAGDEKWVDDMMGWVDWEQTRRTDGAKLRTLEERRTFLKKAYETLIHDGANKYNIHEGRLVRGFADKLEDHRVLHFKNSDAWLAMHETYGNGQIFDVLLQHVADMAHEIAVIERFGPSPMTTIGNMARMMKKLAPNSGEAEDEIKKMNAVMATVMRETGASRTNAAGNLFAGIRNFLTASLLGSASLIAIPSDINMAVMAAKYNRLEGMQFVRRYLSLMNPANAADRQLAVRLGLIAEHVSAEMYGARRWIGFDATGPSWTRRLADVTMNLSLLSPHTQMAKWAFSMEMLGLFADNAGKGFDELPFKQMLERHGVTSAEWDRFRALPKFEERGATFLRPDDLYDPKDRKAVELMAKLKAMILDETRIAVPDVNLLARNALLSDSQPGTFIGELGRSAAMFKNFPLTFLFTHMRRYGMTAAAEGKSRMAWMGYMIVSMTMLGAFRNQMTNIMQGKDPQTMDPRDDKAIQFWFHSLVTGGGLGIAGDYFFADYNRFGGGPLSAMAGPVAQFGEDTAKLTVGNVREVFDGKKTDFMEELMTYGQRYAPGSRNWWSRLMVDRLVWDSLTRLTDPEAEKKFREQRKRREKDYGLTQWWGRGETTPSRAPDLGRVVNPPG
jgi:hypothetical protein